MAVVKLVQFLLLLFAFRCECTVEILRRMAEPNIQLVSVRSSYDKDTGRTSSSVIFTGPSDTIDMAGRQLTKVSITDDKFSVFKTEIEVYGPPTKEYSFYLFSASTSEWFGASLKGKETSVLLDSFPGESCTFEVKKETDGRILTYNADKGCGCNSKPEENLKIWSEFTYRFIDDQDRQYNNYFFLDDYDYDFDINDFLNRTDSRLIINNEQMKKKGFNLTEVMYNMWMWSNDDDIGYSWQIYPE